MAEKRVIELDIQTNEKSLKSQLKEAQAEVQKLADKFGATSQEAVNAAKKASQLKDAISDAKDLTDAFSPDAKFNALSKSIGGVLDGFQAFEGALGLVGVEGEAVQETMLKVQSAMALSQGVQGVFEARDSFKQLGAVIKDAAIKLGILTVVKEADTVATVENVVATEAQVVANQQAAVSFKATGVAAKTSLNGIKGAIAATGIGLLVIALGAIVVYWDDIKAAVSGVSSEQAKLNELSHANFETSKEQLSNLDAQDNVLKLQGKSEREILNLKIAKVNTAIELGKIELNNVLVTSKAEEAAAIQNYNMTKKVVDFILDTALFLPKLMLMPIDMAIKGANKVSEALGFGKLIAFDMGKTMEDMQDKLTGFVAGSIFNVPELKKENALAAKEIEKSLKDLENQKAGFQLSIQEMDKGAAQTSVDTKKAELDALIELEIRKDQTDKQRLTQLLDERLKLEKLKGNQLLLAQQDNEAKIRQAIEEDNKDVISLELKKITDLKVISNTKLESLKGGLNAEIEAERLAAEHKTLILEVQATRARKLEEQSQSFKVKSVQQGLEIIASLTELFGKKSEKAARKAFQIQKAANIASALITTYQNATSAYASQFLPVPDPSSPIRGGVASGLAIATGLVNVAKIASQKFEGGGSSGSSAPSGGGGGSAGGGAIAPNFNVIGSSGVNQLAQIQQQPTRAYVVSGDVATGLSLERNRLQNASF
jgi:uncharacterized membrane protein YgcG